MTDRGARHVQAGEVETTLVFLDYLRASVVLKVEDLTEADARRRFVATETTLLGLVQHLTMAEAYWFERVWLGADVELPPGSMTVGPDTDVATVVATYEARTAQSNAAIAGAEPEDLSAGSYREHGPQTLRWILVHMVEETARHAGHADILRELLDGSTGR